MSYLTDFVTSRHISMIFFKFVTQDSFKYDISIITKEEYDTNKKDYKDSMIFENFNIIRNLKKLINPKKLGVEKQIVNRFLSEYDSEYSYIVLKNEIQKAYQLSKDVLDFMNESKKKNENVNMLKINTFILNDLKTP